MTKKMLIDATHPEETRVAIVSGNRLEEYDYENALRKQLKSNIYLVKVTRVEPSLQAAFVDFGGNRHGFLPFPEIHPDYYRIPIADREALLAEERAIAAREAARQDAEDEAELARIAEKAARGSEDGDDEDAEDAEEEAIEVEAIGADDEDEDEDAGVDLDNPRRRAADASLARRVADKLAAEAEDEDETDDEGDAELAADSDDEDAEDAEDAEAPVAETAAEDSEGDDEDEEEDGEELGGDTVEQPAYRSSIKRRYKIQEVIKRNQIMLIQISKEERGNKGAAVTSYISLPGRYCVLMPNSPRGGGVSRKVSNAKDRQRLKTILRELNVPEGMSVILRTAGVSRTTAEIKRDLDYLLRLWDEIREYTLRSTAPQLIYEEGNLTKRAIRDLYKRDIDEIHVAGEEGYKTARDFMQMLAPSNVDKVHHYTDSLPLFYRYQVDSQIDAIQTPTVHLKSGGYIVINPTEALVSIDVNSGRATKGRHIEETALKTNIEAAEEIARQLRLRDQGGLIVIDFIDMEDRRANRIVEKKLRDAMQNDRARIQLGRISPFGLLELSRQRLHPSLVETNFETCKHCAGTGMVRTADTMAVMVLRAIEEEAMKGRANELKVTVPTEVALYIFNHKRENLAQIEKRYNLRVFIAADERLIKPAFNIEGARGQREERQQRQRPAPVQSLTMGSLDDFDAGDGDSAMVETADGDEDNGEGRQGRRRDRNNGRRRGGRNRDRDRNGRRGGRDRDQQAAAGEEEQPRIDMDAAGETGDSSAGFDGDADTANGEDGDNPRRRRGRRGGRRRGGRNRRRENGDGSDAGNEGGEGNDAAAPQDFTAPAANDSPREQPRQATASVHNRGDEGDNDDQQEAANGSRKGWWKRLTE